MIRFLHYLSAQTKRAIKIYPAIIFFTALLTICISVIFTSILIQSDEDESQMKIPVGVVGDFGDSFLGVGMFALKNFDSSKYYLDFISMTEDEAEKELESNDIRAYIVIPENFIENAINGDTQKIQYVSKNNPAILGPILMEEIISVVSDMVIDSQKGIYGFDAILDKYGTREEKSADLIKDISLDYVDIILDRENIFSVKYVDNSGGLGFKEYYFCVFFMLIVLLCGIICVQYATKSDLSLSRLLYSKGYGVVMQTIADFIPMFAMIALTSILCISVIGAFMGGGVISHVSSVKDVLLFAIRALPSIVLVTVMQFLVYELVSNIISGVLLQVLVTVSTAYVSGLFFPIYTLPSAVRSLARFIPTKTAFDQVGNALRGDFGIFSVLLCVMYSVLLFALACAARKFKLRRCVCD